MSSPDVEARRVAAGSPDDQAWDEPELGTEGLRDAGAQGVKWSFLQTVGSLVGRLAFTFVLVRLVGPSSFGIIAQATIYITLLQVVLSQGFGPALVQRKVLDPRDVGTVTWMNLATGVVLTVATLLVAPAVADFFNSPELVDVLRVLSVVVLVKAFQLVPRALVRRRMLFRSQTIIDLVATVVGGVAGIVAAVAGADYWALVLQTVVYEVLVLIGLNVLVWNLRSFRWSSHNLRSLWGFSAGLLGSQFLIFFGQNFDNVLIGRYESARQLAFYALSYRLLRMPLQLIGGVANTVSLPIFARLQDDDERMASWYLRSTSLVALTAFPALTLLVVGADSGIPLVFGDEWRPAVTPLMILAAAGTADVVRMLMSPVAQAKARTDLVFWWALLTFGIQGVAFVIGIQFGIVGVAVGYAATTLVLWPFNVLHFSRTVLVAMTMGDYGRSLLPAATGSAALAAVWLAMERSLVGMAGAHPALGLVAATLAGGVCYLAVIMLAFPAALATTRDVARLMLRRAA